ncbi:fungal pheromone mating factor STE2 GPCR-domain-containing protein [Clohesyomyces aquaticus]|uniref:Fungal pheromone mating factor STE2 GPCR-domain-containing protein n=1 Tax=Clohesyomyces aquaticus TaxID=1231657 RepID=A0A1Y1ZXC6_9PLEO|nr:fungal pheromone mating factor STE2 GPCR-domain-containing protein [Clohesyomyces aquaticus]
MADTNQLPPSDFDPWTQVFTLETSDGEFFNASMADLDAYRVFGVRLSINYGTQIGASFLLLLVLFLLTNRERRRSWIFIMNTLCLAINVIRSTLQVCYGVSEFFHPYTVLSGDFARVTAHDQAITICGNVMNFILVVCVMVSLSLQVWVVCVTTGRIQRLCIMAFTTLVALNAAAWRLAVTVVSNQLTLKFESMESNGWLVHAQYISMAIAIWVFCVVFTLKLGYALVQRKRLGMSQFGPMQIIFIMGCQTMILPAIFTMFEFQEKVPELGSQTLTIVCIFLPLSAIWAGVVSKDPGVAARGPDAHHRLLAGQMGRTSTSSSTNQSNKSHFASVKAPDTPYSPNTPLAAYKEKEDSQNGSFHENFMA